MSDILAVDIQTEGIIKLLQDLDTHKATGPDAIPRGKPRFLYKWEVKMKLSFKVSPAVCKAHSEMCNISLLGFLGTHPPESFKP